MERSLGLLQGEVHGLRDRVERMEHELEKNGKKIDDLVIALSEARGGWKALVATGILGAVVGYLLSMIGGL